MHAWPKRPAGALQSWDRTLASSRSLATLADERVRIALDGEPARAADIGGWHGQAAAVQTAEMASKKPRGSSVADTSVPLRIVVVNPPPDVAFCVQGKRGECLAAQRSRGDDLVFDVELHFGPSTAKDATERAAWIAKGPLAQGPPVARFLYVCSGTSAGDRSSPWTRRAKIPLRELSRALVEQAKPGQRLTATIAGRARDGGPACASVPLLGAGWRWTK